MALEFTSKRSSHVLGTDDGSLSGGFHSVDGVDGTLSILVDVEGHNIRFLSLVGVELFMSVTPVPESSSNRLRWVGISGPFE